MKKTFKKLTAAFIAAAMAVTALPQTALAESDDFLQSEGLQPASVVVGEGDSNLYEGFRYKELEDGTLAITKYNGGDIEVVVPSEINGKKVTVIGDSAFRWNYQLEKITIPDSLTTIEAYAFAACSSLTEINFSDNITSIGIFALQGCSSLTEINVDENNKNFCSIDGVLFNKDATTLIRFPCSKAITSYMIPDGVTTIDDEAFDRCELLTVIHLPDSVTIIENEAFGSCSSLTEINLPDGLTTIGEEAFVKCESLTKITIPKSVTTIKKEAFGGCSSLTEITIPNGVTAIGDSTFAYCTSLTEINLPDSLTSIGAGAFEECSSLSQIILPDSLTTIWDSAFYGCSSLTEITIPDSVTTLVFGSIFSNCSSLTEINVDENNKNFCSIDGVWFNKDVTELIQFPCGKDVTSYEIPDSVISIKNGAFEGCSLLKEITIPKSSVSIWSHAFYGCKSLTTINFSEGLIIIGGSAFCECTSLTEINLPDSLTTIDSCVFEDCSSLTKITIPTSVTKIGYNAFFGCPDLTIYGYTNSYAETYANEYKIPFVSIGLFLNSESDVSVTADTNVIPDDTKLYVKQTEKTETSVSYNITLTCNGEEIQPEGNVTVRIPVPEGWDTENIYVYHRDANGRLTEIKAAVSGGYIIFTTNHFSEYVLTTEKQTTIKLGDVDGNGEVDELDSVALARYLASWNVAIDQSAADVDGNGDIDELDSVMLARKLAGWNV